MPLPRLAIGAIVKNEAPYLLEWIAFHRVLGVTRFFIADNGSDDGGGALLAALDAAGLVRHLPFPDRPGVRPQLPAYRAILAAHGHEADWIAFIDADEFLLPACGPAGAFQDALPRFVARLGADASVGAVAVNWALYGSSGRLEAGPGLVVERFARRAEQGLFPANHHFKSILRTAAGPEPGGNPHAFRLPDPWRTVQADGRDLAPHPLGINGLSREVVWGPLRLNHYVVKSREEFLTRKLPRGRATTDRLRAPGFFEVHDRNEVADPVDPALARATRRERARIAAGSSAASASTPRPTGRPAWSRRSRKGPRTRAARRTASPPGQARLPSSRSASSHAGAAGRRRSRRGSRRRRARRGSRRNRDRRSRRSRPGPAPPRARWGSTT